MKQTVKKFFAVSAIFATLTLSHVAFSAENFDAAAKYAKTCGVCHNSGVAGAPKKGDTKAWKARLTKGETVLLNSVVNGVGAMPAKGLCNDCDDAQFSTLIKYMSN